MVKKSEINKKGRLAKSTLSVVLAASMVLTSSSFVWAAPVEDIAIVEEGDTAVEAVGTSIDDVSEASVEENVGVTQTISEFKLGTNSFTFTNATSTQTAIWTALKAAKVTTGGADYNFPAYLGQPNLYTVTIENLSTKDVTTLTTVDQTIPTDIGTYRVKVTGVPAGERDGTAWADYSIVSDVQSKVEANIPAQLYTGNPIYPSVPTMTLKASTGDVTLHEGTDYNVVDYQYNTDVCEKGKGAYIQVEFIKNYKERGIENFYFEISAAKLTDKNTRINVTESVFNGTEQTPELKIEYKKDSSTNYVTIDPSNYTVKVTSGTKAINAGTYPLTITFKNNYAGTLTPNFVIKQQEFNTSTVTIETPVVEFKGEKTGHEATVIIKDAATGEVVYNNNNTNGISVKYVDSKGGYASDNWMQNKKEGSYGILITSDGTGNYKTNATGIKKTYTVGYVAPSLQKYLADSGSDIKAEYEYKIDGNVPASVTINGTTYKADGTRNELTVPQAGWFDVVFPSKDETKKVGSYEIKLVGKGEWAGQTASISYNVIAKKVGNVVSDNRNSAAAPKSLVKGPEAVHKTSTGALTATFSFKDGTYTLVNGTDYTYEIVSGTINGNYRINVTFMGNYTGTYERHQLTISSLSLNAVNIKAEVLGEYVYNGKIIKPADENIVLTEVNGDKSVVLRQGIDYTIDGYGRNIEVGKGIVKVTGIGTYSGAPITREVQFDIKAGETEKDNYILDTADLKAVYDGDDTFNPAGDIKVKTTAGKTLAENVDYTIKYLRDSKEITAAQAKTVGNVTMEITIKSTQTKLTAAYRVARALEKAADIPEKIADAEYTGQPVEPTVKVTRKNSAIELKKDVDFTVSYENNTDVGTGYAIIEGIGDYYGTYVRKFNIVGQMDQEIVVLAAQERDLKTRTLKSKATVVKYTVAPKTDTTYTSSNPEVVTVDAATGAIEYKSVGTATITISAAESDIYKAATKTLTVKVLPTTPANVKVTSTAKKKITVKADEVPEAAKYQIKIWKTGKKAVFVNVDNKGDLSKVYTTKSAGKFNVQVRAYKTIDNVHHFSAWSAVKKVTVK